MKQLLSSNTHSRLFPSDYNGGHIAIPDHDDLDITEDFTLEAWMRSSYPGTGTYLLSKHQHSVNDDGSWNLECGNGFLRFNALASVAAVVFDSDADVIPDDEWVHVALTYDESEDTYSYYVNASPAGSGTAGLAGKIENTVRPLWIGAMEAHDVSFHGWIDEVQIWNECRTQSQVYEDMSAPEPATLALLVMGGLTALRRRKRA